MKRKPFVAAGLSILATGLGHIYVGKLAKGILLFCSWFLVLPLSLLLVSGEPSTAMLAGTLATIMICSVGVYLFAICDSFVQARRLGPDYSLREYNRPPVYFMLGCLGVLYPVACMVCLRLFVIEAFMIPTRSMNPTIVDGDRVLVSKLPDDRVPRYGDLVVFRPPGQRDIVFVKRVIGLGGDRIEFRGKQVLLNGDPLARQLIDSKQAGLSGESSGDQIWWEANAGKRYRIQLTDSEDSVNPRPNPAANPPPWTVPKDTVFVLGDCRDRSRDSRSYGPVPIGDIIGKVKYIHLPAANWNRFGAVR